MSKLSSLKRKAREAEAREDWVQAIELYGRAVAEAREDGSATFEVGLYNRMGDLYLEMDDTSQAVYHYLLAAEEYAEEGLHPSAIALCEKVLRVAPDQLDAYRQLAELHAETGLIADARRELSSYLDGVWESGQIAEALPGLIDLMERLSAPVPGYDEARELGEAGDTEEAFELAYEAWGSAPAPSEADEAAREAEVEAEAEVEEAKAEEEARDEERAAEAEAEGKEATEEVEEEESEEEGAEAEVGEEEAGDEVEVAAAEAEAEEEEAAEEVEEEAAGPEEAGLEEAADEQEEPEEPAVDPAVLRQAAAELASTPAVWKAPALAADESGPSLLPAEAAEAADLPRVHPTRPVPWRRALERREDSRDRAAAEERSRRRAAGAPPYARRVAEAFRAGLEASEVRIRPGRPRPAGPPGTPFATPGRSDYLPAGAEATGGPRTSGLSWLADAVGALIGPEEGGSEARAATAESRAEEAAAAVEEPAADAAVEEAAVAEPEEEADRPEPAGEAAEPDGEPEAAEERAEVAAEADDQPEETPRPAEAEAEESEPAEEAEDLEEAPATAESRAEEAAAAVEEPAAEDAAADAAVEEAAVAEPEEEADRPEPAVEAAESEGEPEAAEERAEVAAEADDEPEETAPEPAAEAEAADEEPEAEERGPEIAITRAAFELAAEHGIELTELEGTGEDGRILKADVEAALEAKAPADIDERKPAREADEAQEEPAADVEPADVSPAREVEDAAEEGAGAAAGADVDEADVDEEEEAGDEAPERPTIELPETEPGPAPGVESGDGNLDFTELLRHVGWLNRRKDAEQTEEVEPAEPPSTADGAPLAPWRAPDERPDEEDGEASDLTGLLNDIGWLDEDEAEAREEGSNRTS